MKRLGVIGVLLLVASCGGNEDEPDGGARLACMHFRNVAADYSDGVLTIDELRDKLAEVEDDASVSEEPGIASAARAMLAAITQGDMDGLAEQIPQFDAACKIAGA